MHGAQYAETDIPAHVWDLSFQNLGLEPLCPHLRAELQSLVREDGLYGGVGCHGASGQGEEEQQGPAHLHRLPAATAS
uniref:Uncharacterized protein n=1 Tax=Anguilla anguilla TaxID=7936 RepID=A0A0E9SY35_ANGAN